jgi:prepilin-type N-terminal cleavage/methylation domain-containing protein
MRLQRNRNIWNDWIPKNPVHHQPIRRGFSLVELVVYVAIVAILAIAFIRVLDHTEKAKVASVTKTARLINDVAVLFLQQPERGQLMFSIASYQLQ